MVSALWKACSDGDIETVQNLLNEASSVDIEIKDHTGATPLIQAVKNGHVDVARALLDKGADPNNASSQGPPEQHTTDPAILDLLNQAKSKISDAPPSQEPGCPQNTNDDAEKRYYEPQPPVPYPYYSAMSSVPPMTEGGVYYPPMPPAPSGDGTGGFGNLPPPEIARLIPCRYFPACRYGSSCIFAHPQPPYFQGTMPQPAQYVPPYDPATGQPYAHNYYTMSPASFPGPNGAPPPSSQNAVHGRSSSEAVSPAQPHYPPPAVAPSPYGPMPPSTYPQSTQPPVPMPVPPLQPMQHQPGVPHPGHQSPSHLYNPTSASQFNVTDVTGQYALPQLPNSLPYSEANGDIKPMLPSVQQDPNSVSQTPIRDNGQGRRGVGRRSSFGGRKPPPCLFFPSGRCKNGDDCRFPHIIPEGPQNVPYFSGRGGGPRPRHHSGNGIGTINEKMSHMTIREDSQQNGQNKTQATELGRPRFATGSKNNHIINGNRSDKKLPPTKQRVPNADDFPVLAGSITPPSKSPGANGLTTGANGQAMPTAAQVLQAPPPQRKDNSKESSTRGTTPDPAKSAATKDAKIESTRSGSPGSAEASVNKLSVSFAAAATGAQDASKEITLPA